MALVSVNANSIDNAGVAVDAELPVAWIDAELADAETTGRAPGHLTARLSRSGNDIVVHGQVKASVSTPCARCTEPAPVDVDTEIALLLKPVPVLHGKKAVAAAAAKASARESQKGAAGQPAAGRARTGGRGRGGRNGGGDALAEYEFSAEEADTDTFDGETVVLDPFIREAILLELPNFPLCSEECAGIRAPAVPALGRSGGKPVDPRLAPLGALRAKLASMSGDGAGSDDAGSTIAGVGNANADTTRAQPVRKAPPPKPRSKNGPKLKANAAPRPKKKRK